MIYNIDFEIVAIAVAVFFDVYALTRYSRETVQNVRFVGVSHALTLVIATELIWIASVNFGAPVLLKTILHSIYFIFLFIFTYNIDRYIASYIDEKNEMNSNWRLFNKSVMMIACIVSLFYIVIRFTETSAEEQQNQLQDKFIIFTLVIIGLFFSEAVIMIFMHREKFTKPQMIIYSILFLYGIALPVIQANHFPHMRVTGFYYVITVFVILLYIETPDEQALKSIVTNLNSIKEGLEKKVDEENDRLKKLDEKEYRLSNQLMFAMSRTIDAKDQYTCGHSSRVAKYSKMLAKKLGLSLDEQDQIFTMGILHDLGKVAVPNAIINKPGKLTDEEFAIMKSHPVKGYDILSKVSTLPNLADGARWHHERIDGRGYPDHLAGDEIPYFSRIICVADAYDAMTSYRSYRGVMSQDKVREQIVNGLGTQFDFEIGQKMLEIIDEDVNYELHEVREETFERAKGAAS